MGGASIDYVYLGDILKYEELDDGSLMVFGKATGPDLDLDRQVCDTDWLKSAMPAWFAYGNVREQHSNIAAGVGVEMEERDGSYYVKSHIVDAGTVRKVKNKTLKGYSVGIRNGAVVKDKAAPGGRIVKGEIYELSLVDRPANPACTITMVKALGDGPELSFLDAEDGSFGRLSEPELIDFDGLDKGAAAIEAAEEELDRVAALPVSEEAAEFDDDDEDGELSLFDGLDLDGLREAGPGAIDLDDDAEEYEGGKGLLDTLLNGPEPRDPKRGAGGRFAGSNRSSDAEARRKQRAKERAEREEQRKRRVAENMADAEREADASRAERGHRYREAAEHRGTGRTRTVSKALSLVEVDDDTRLYAGRTRLVRSILEAPLDDLVVEKAAGGGHDESEDIEGAREVIAQIAELIISEATALAEGRYEEIDDIRMLLEAIEAVKRFCHREMRQAGMDWTEIERAMEPVPGSYVKAVGGAPASTPVDTSSEDTATLIQAEITKAVAQVTEAHEVQLAELNARLAKHEARPIPGGPQLAPAHLVRASAAASVAPEITKAAMYRESAALPGLDAGIAASYRAAAEQLERNAR